jgi:hypothetical protein
MCDCLQITGTPSTTGIEETVEVFGVLVAGFNQYNFVLGEQAFYIIWDGELWTLWAEIPGDDTMIGSSTAVDCPTSNWSFDPDLGPYYLGSNPQIVECADPDAETQAQIDCYNALVWQKQCEFSKDVLSYLKSLEFGFACCDALEELKNKRRVLGILNCYDLRDINNAEPVYNTLPYDTINDLLNS